MVSLTNSKKILRSIYIWYGFLILGIPLYIFSVHIDFLGLYGGLPPLDLLENPKDDYSSELYSSDGVLLGRYFRYNRSPVDFNEISPNVINALLATEDYRFESHSGIDIKAILRAGILSIILQKKRGGGSTLTQQLAKNLFKLRRKSYDGLLSKVPIIRMLITKTKEWIIAIRLERAYTKREIIALYLNTTFFGSNAYGINIAANTFFQTTPKELNLNQAATLIGLLKAPSYYSPIRNMDKALQRRNTVLNQMYKYGFISQQECEKIKSEPIQLQLSIESHNTGKATYFRSAIRDFLLKWTKKHGYDLFEDGLKIYTTLDSRLQEIAEKSVAIHMKKLQAEFDEHWKNRNPWCDESGNEIKNFIQKAIKRTTLYKDLCLEYKDDTLSIDNILNTPIPKNLFTWNGEISVNISPIDELKYNKRLLHAGFMAMNPNTGEIKAWVGGINHEHFKFDHVMQGTRQPGSAFKPIVYCAAIENGIMPWDTVIDAPVTFVISSPPFSWTPQNWNKVYSGDKMTLRQSMGKSINSITAYLTKQITPEVIADYAKRLGIRAKIDPHPAICLGVTDVSIYELVGAYSTFMNKGVWIEPHFILRIEDKNGKILEEFKPIKKEAITESTAYLMVHLLKGTTEEHGAISASIPYYLRENNEICGKTGTTQNQSDGWFVGLSKNLCVGVWVGGDDRCIHFRDIAHGSGAHMAGPIWQIFMTELYKSNLPEYSKGPLLNYPIPEELEKYSEYLGQEETIEPDQITPDEPTL